jgi:methyl-accepting chemotaxis protein
MPRIILKVKSLTVFLGCLCSLVFFATTAISADIKEITAIPVNVEGVNTLLASVTEDKPLSQKVYMQVLKREMDHVFEVLSAIMKDESLSEEEKKSKAIEYIRNYRYGPEKKRYFWINDTKGLMILHPYIPDLEGKVVTNVRDSKGTQIYVEFINVCLEKGEGFVSYAWAEREGEKPIQRTSLVKLLRAWRWIIGTGLYFEGAVEAYEMPLREPGIPLLPIDDRYPASPV